MDPGDFHGPTSPGCNCIPVRGEFTSGLPRRKKVLGLHDLLCYDAIEMC